MRLQVALWKNRGTMPSPGVCPASTALRAAEQGLSIHAHRKTCPCRKNSAFQKFLLIAFHQPRVHSLWMKVSATRFLRVFWSPEWSSRTPSRTFTTSLKQGRGTPRLGKSWGKPPRLQRIPRTITPRGFPARQHHCPLNQTARLCPALAAEPAFFPPAPPHPLTLRPAPSQRSQPESSPWTWTWPEKRSQLCSTRWPALSGAWCSLSVGSGGSGILWRPTSMQSAGPLTAQRNPWENSWILPEESVGPHATSQTVTFRPELGISYRRSPTPTKSCLKQRKVWRAAIGPWKSLWLTKSRTARMTWRDLSRWHGWFRKMSRGSPPSSLPMGGSFSSRTVKRTILCNWPQMQSLSLPNPSNFPKGRLNPIKGTCLFISKKKANTLLNY